MTADLVRLKALALAAIDAADRPGTSLTNEFLAFVDEATPAAVLELLAQLERATAQNKALLDERNALIIERNRALVQAIKAEQKLTRIRGLSEIGMCECDQIAEIAKSSSDPNDELDDVLPLWPRVTRTVTKHPLAINLPASLDLPDTEGGSHD